MTATACESFPVAPARSAPPTIWGCTPHQVHDRFWAAFGVQVVRRGERSEVVAGAELFLLCGPDVLVLLRLSDALDTLYWRRPALLVLRLRDPRRRAYHERVAARGGRLVRFERVYRDARTAPVRVALTSDRDLARRWQNLPDSASPWRTLSRSVPAGRRDVGVAPAHVYDGRDAAQVMECLYELVGRWRRPDATLPRARKPRAGVLADPSAVVDPRAKIHGPVLVGAGRRLGADARVVGPAVLWDDPARRPPPGDVRWQELEPTSLDAAAARPVRARAVPMKRAFDVAFAAAALAATLPLYPLIALAVLIEDGRPVFFAQRRETVGGREFACLKFRSMRRNADKEKAALVAANEADGPQFFIAADPRTTRVGRLLRKFHLDELPQFLNVLVGDMSVVGPRPSPYAENQYCPAWREARLSVRPGVTGLWQVSRTRRRGLDFQEWIRFDLDYVADASWALDLRIVAKTLALVVRGGA